MSQAGEIDVIGNNPQIPTQFDGDTGNAVPIGNILNIVGTGGIATSASGNTVTIDGSGAGSIELTADDANSLNGNAFNLFGQQASTIPVMDTLVAAGNFYFENRAWETPYIVDASTAAGLRGTFTTIQAALNQAVIDGMTFSSPRQIYIRTGTYTENLTIPGGAYFSSSGLQTDPSSVPAYTVISGNHTLADICLFSSNGIQWQTAVGDMFTAGSTFTFLIGTNSEFSNAGVGQILNVPTGSTGIFLDHCNFASARGDFGTVFTLASVDACQITDCYFSGCGFETGGGVLRLSNCSNVGEVNINAAAFPGIVASNCTFVASLNSNIYGLGSANLVSCGFSNNDNTKYATDLVNASMVSCYMTNGVTQPSNFVNPATNTALYTFNQVGNVLGGLRSAVSLAGSPQSNYVGITSTAAPRSVVINRGPADYQVYVVDESGGAGTNNITVTSSGGELINGAASYVINRNYGSALFHSDGTNWFVSASASDAGDVNGPLSSTDNALVRFDGATGKLIQNGVVTQDDTGNISQSASVPGASLSTITSNTSNTASATAFNQVEVAGSTASDAFYRANINGGQAWTWGLDNSDSDAFVISADTSLGTTNVMKVDTAGQITYPLQPAFLAQSAAQTDVTGDGTAYTIQYTNEIFDRNSDFDGVSTFTAPVTGIYQLNTTLSATGFTSGHTTGVLSIVTTARTYTVWSQNAADTATPAGANRISGSVLASMTAGDTATVVLTVSTTAKTVDIQASPGSFFSGYLVA